MENRISRTIEFGKVAYSGSAKANMMDVELALTTEQNGDICFTACGHIWNRNHSDIECGGQILDEMLDYIHSPLFYTIHRLWKAYHLNTMHAGTEAQEAELEAWHKQTGHGYGVAFGYEADRKHLKDVGLYEAEYEGKPYKYGHGWLTRPIPADDMKLIQKIIETGNT